jgi:DNA-binding transcriptional LysR family regulator
VQPADLDGLPFVSYDPESGARMFVAAIAAERKVNPNIVLVAKVSQTLCQFVAAGYGVSIVHPVSAKEFGERLVVRPFKPATLVKAHICNSKDSRNVSPGRGLRRCGARDGATS